MTYWGGRFTPETSRYLMWFPIRMISAFLILPSVLQLPHILSSSI
jgi:hypothetical protein